jgi:hypothetical protein
LLPLPEADGTYYNSFLVETHLLIEQIEKMYAIGFKFDCHYEKCDKFRDESDINPPDLYESCDDVSYDGNNCKVNVKGEHHPDCKYAQM